MDQDERQLMAEILRGDRLRPRHSAPIALYVVRAGVTHKRAGEILAKWEKAGLWKRGTDEQLTTGEFTEEGLAAAEGKQGEPEAEKETAETGGQAAPRKEKKGKAANHKDEGGQG